MSWKARVKSNLASGAYEKSDGGAFAALAEGFASVYIPMKTKEKEAKLKAEAKALEKVTEKAEEDKLWRQRAETLAAQIFPDNPNSKAAVDYTYSVIASYEGNVGQATDRLEKLSTEDRLEIMGPLSPMATDSTAALFSEKESGSGGYDALLNQSQTNQFSDVRVSTMSMDEVLEFSAPGSDYFNYGKENAPKGTFAAKNNLATTPMGQYQFVGSTLQDIKDRGGFEALGITGETKFDQETQDALFVWYANDMLKTAGDDQNKKRSVLKGIWEGFGSASDEELDAVITDLETGTFTEPSGVETRPASKPFDVGAELGNLTYDQDGLDKFELLKARINSEGYDLTDTQLEMVNAVEKRIREKVGDAAIFNYSDFLEKDRLTSADKVIGAMSVIDNMDVTRFKNGEKDRTTYLRDLKDELDKFMERDLQEEMRKAAANRDPMIFYPRNADGTLKLTPISVMVEADGSLKTVGSNQTVDMGTGKLVPSDYDASEFIKIFNKPIMEASQMVESGIAGIDNLMEYRKLTVENPAAYNTYLDWANNAGKQLSNMYSTFNTLVESGASYEEVELEILNNLDGLAGPAREIFIRQLEAAYSLAKLKGSSGQGLSDNELDLNLRTVGFGAKKAKDALRAINIATKRFLVNVEAERRGIISGLIGDDDYTQSIQSKDLGRKFSDVVNERFGENPELSKQLELALSGDLTVSQTTVIEEDPPETPETTVVSFEEFVKAMKEANPDADPALLTDEALRIEYEKTFPTTE